MTALNTDGGYPANHCSFCHAPGDGYLTRVGDVVIEWPCDEHLVWTLEKLQRREAGSTEVVVKKITRQRTAP